MKAFSSMETSRKMSESGKDVEEVYEGQVAIRHEDIMVHLTPIVQQELKAIIEELCTLTIPSSCGAEEYDRPRQVERYKELKMGVSTDTKMFIDTAIMREDQHADFMRHLLENEIESFTDDVRAARLPHDITKDELFCFVMCTYFNAGLEATEDAGRLRDAQLNYHYSQEAHHPEYERLTNKECTAIDIEEMGIDRMARNLQLGDSGFIDWKKMDRFAPDFVLGDVAGKKLLWWKFVAVNASIVENAFHMMYPNALTWGD